MSQDREKQRGRHQSPKEKERERKGKGRYRDTTMRGCFVRLKRSYQIQTQTNRRREKCKRKGREQRQRARNTKAQRLCLIQSISDQIRGSELSIHSFFHSFIHLTKPLGINFLSGSTSGYFCFIDSMMRGWAWPLEPKCWSRTMANREGKVWRRRPVGSRTSCDEWRGEGETERRERKMMGSKTENTHRHTNNDDLRATTKMVGGHGNGRRKNKKRKEKRENQGRRNGEKREREGNGTPRSSLEDAFSSLNVRRLHIFPTTYLSSNCVSS